MATPPRQTPPSAIDGYRRLARTRSAVAPSGTATRAGAVEARDDADAPRLRRRRRPGFAGTARLAGFVAVLAVIIGTSVSLASADQSTSPAAPSEPKSAAAVQGPVARAADEPAAKVDDSEPAADDAEVTVASTTVVADEPAAVPARPAAALPFTGPALLEQALLGGALLVLLGMLVQVAGQPLPARAVARH